MSMLDELFNLDMKADIKYTPISTDKINKKINKISKNVTKSMFNKLTNDSELPRDQSLRGFYSIEY